MRNALRLFAAVMALGLAACHMGEVSASAAGTFPSTDFYRMGNSGPFQNRKDGLGFDVDNYGPGLVTNGEIDRMFSSSLYVSVWEDFLGQVQINDTSDTDDIDQGMWGSENTGTATCVTRKANFDNGALELKTDNGNEVGDCDLNFGDVLSIDSDTEPFCIFRIQAQTAPVAADTLFWGFTSAQNDLINSTTLNAGFSVAGADLNLDMMSDDNTTDVNATDTTIDIVAGTFYEYMISMNSMHNGTSDKSDYCSPTNVCGFYRTSTGSAWTRLLPNTTFSVGANVALQPAVHIEKTSGTSTPDLLVDYVACAWQREQD